MPPLPQNGTVQWPAGTVGPYPSLHPQAQDALPLSPTGGQSYTTIGTSGSGCPPGWQTLPGGMCGYCPPNADPSQCQPIPLVMAWRIYDQTQASGGGGGATNVTNVVSPPPPPSPPASPPFLTPPPPPPPSPPITAGGGGGTYSTVGGSGSLGGKGSCPPGWVDLGNGACTCLANVNGTLTPQRIMTYAQAWQAYAQGMRCGTAASPPPPPPPPPPPLSPSACPQTYTILKGPLCPVYTAIPGSPEMWSASGFVLPSIFSVLQTMTDTPANVQTAVNNLSTQCIATALKALSPSPPPG